MNTRKETAFPSLRMRLDTSRFSLMQYSAEALYIRTANLSNCPFHSIRSMTAIMMPFTGEASISYGQGRHTNGNAVTAISRSIPMTHMRMNHSSRMRRQKNESLFPHAKANIETRGESVFAARNAIDGIVASNGHGEWPWSSWGINRDPEAELTLDFGRNVEIDRIIVYTRADFPHDAWWDEGTFSFSDGSELVVKLEKKDGPQEFTFEKKTVSSLSLSRLIKSSDPSPFPALIQLEVYGNDC